MVGHSVQNVAEMNDMSLQNVPIMVDRSMMEFPSMRGMSIQNVAEMKSGFMQAIPEMCDKGQNTTIKKFVDNDCQVTELTAPWELVKYSKHNKFPIYFDNDLNTVNVQKWSNSTQFEEFLDCYETHKLEKAKYKELLRRASEDVVMRKA